MGSGTGVGVDQKDCPECAETVKGAAKVCRYCGYRFDALVVASTDALVKTEAPILTERQLYVLAGQAARDASPWKRPPPSSRPASGPTWWERVFGNARLAKRFTLFGLGSVALAALTVPVLRAKNVDAENPDRPIASISPNPVSDEQVEDHRKGFHCLYPVDGSNPDLVLAVKNRLAEPSSFEHVQTTVFPRDMYLRHRVLMIFRFRDAAGAVTRGRAIGYMNGADCGTTLSSVE